MPQVIEHISVKDPVFYSLESVRLEQVKKCRNVFSSQYYDRYPNWGAPQ